VSLFDRLVSNSLGTLAVLLAAAFLEAWGDSFFQTSFYRASGMGRVLAFLAGAAVLALYGSVVNVPRWEFGKLLGIYVAMFFVAAQVIAKVRFGEVPTMPVYAGGALIVGGGLIVAFWH
jgi:small multidrug resistance family-3 protein